MPNPRGIWITKDNLMPVSIYLAVRHCIKATWLNDRDQFLHPNDKWQTDIEFQNDCLAYTLFSNKIQSEYGTNHWIPFREQEVDAKAKFESNFMTRFMAGKIKSEKNGALFEEKKPTQKTPLVFSTEAKAVFEAGKALWKYYHAQPSYTADNLLYEYYDKPPYNANASLYDIRAHFQGKNARGRMNSKSDDEVYMSHISNLRRKLQFLGSKIADKVFEYRFLKS